ncbi:agmatinase [bacterium]|nr:agmatinase [candidate division CSSED10-310 bacterium]
MVGSNFHQWPSFLGLESEHTDPDRSEVVIVPVPFERTSTFGAGSAEGPRSIVQASCEVELFDCDIGWETFRETRGVVTDEPVIAESSESVCSALDAVVSRWIDAGKTVITVGGEHTSIVGAVKAHCRRWQPVTVIQFDAHSDLRESYLDDPWNHACAMARILEFTPRLVQVGIRSQAAEERERADDLKLPVLYAHAVHAADAAGQDWITPIVDLCTMDVYITFDCDVFDPAVIPATGTPEPGGLTWSQVDRFIEGLTQRRNLVGFDISELAPVPGLHHPQFTIAKMIYRWMGHMRRKH